MKRSLSFLFFGLTLALPAHADAIDAQQIGALQVKAEQSLAGKNGAETYGPAKARAWLDLALEEFYEDDRTGIVQAAVAEAEKLLANPDADSSLSQPLPGSETVRDDLWSRIAAMHASPDFGCAAKQLGQLEVLLNWAGHEKWESGWSHAKPYVEQAENQTYDAEITIKQCEAKRLASAPKDKVASPPTVVTVERYTFSTDALFEFNKDGIEHMVAGGERKLSALANTLKKWQSIKHIEIIGHTDRLGSDKYNDPLSKRRAEHVRQFLVERNLPADRLVASGHGEREPLVHCNGTKKTPSLIECLQPNRRVEIVIQGTR